MPISAYEVENVGNKFQNMFIEQPYTQLKLSAEILKEEVQSVILETDELKFQEEPHAFTRLGILGQSSFN